MPPKLSRAARSQTAPQNHRSYWEQKSLKYDCLHPRMRAMADQVVRLAPHSVLDVGCSTGEMGRAIQAGLPTVAYYGCDISQAAVDKMGRPEVVQRDLNVDGLPFAGQHFDAIVCSGICEYIADLHTFVGDLSTRLPSRGHLVVSYLNIRHVSRLAVRLIGKRAPRNVSWQEILPLGQFETLLERSGLRVQKRIMTNGRIAASQPGWRDTLAGVSQATWGRVPLLARLGAPQMIYVCQKRS